MKEQKINEEITANEVFLIDESGKTLGKISYDQAMWLAYERGFDLVEVGANANPPICKLIDYNKELYQRAKQARKQKAKQRAPEIKEIKLTYNISSHDFAVRLDRAKGFFNQGDKVRVFLILKGRENIFKDKARQLIEDFKDQLAAEYETSIKRMGNQFSALLRKKV